MCRGLEMLRIVFRLMNEARKCDYLTMMPLSIKNAKYFFFGHTEELYRFFFASYMLSSSPLSFSCFSEHLTNFFETSKAEPLIQKVNNWFEVPNRSSCTFKKCSFVDGCCLNVVLH